MKGLELEIFEKKNMINQRKAGVILSYAGELVKILVSLIYTPISCAFWDKANTDCISWCIRWLLT